MTTVAGKLNTNIDGRVTFTPDHAFIDSSTDPDTLVINPIVINFTGGEFTIAVPQSEALQGGEAITYRIRLESKDSKVTFFKQDGTIYNSPTHQHTDNNWYTGLTHTDDSQLLDRVEENEYKLIQNDFHAVVPDESNVEFTELQGIPQLEPWLDIGVARLAELVTSVAKYRDRISSKLVVKGDYDANTQYELGHVISYNGNGYVYSAQSPSTGNTPPTTGNNSFWVMIAEKGSPGGTGAQIVGYNPSTWNNSSEAAARGDVTDAIESIPNPDLSNYLTTSQGLPRANPVMSGSAKRSALTYPLESSEKSTEIPTAQYVEDAIAAAGSGFLPKPLVWARRTTNQLVCSAGSSNGDVAVAWDSVALGAAQVSNGIISIPESGNYLIAVSLHMRAQANSSQSGRDMMFRAYIQRDGSDVGELFRNFGKAYYTGYEELQTFGLYYLHQLNALDAITVRANIRYYNATAFGADSSILGGLQRNYCLLWRVAD